MIVKEISNLGNHPDIAHSSIMVKTRSSYVPRGFVGSVQGKAFVSVFRTCSISRERSAAMAKSISKCLVNMRDQLWALHERIIVLCVSNQHFIDLGEVAPESMPFFEDRREALSQSMRNNATLLPLFIHGPDDILGPVLDDLHLFFLFSFGRQLHFCALPEMRKCFARMGCAISEYANIVAN